VSRGDDQVKDPVCGMMVDCHQHAIEYLKMHFAFCSLPCKERFQANPHLYIGYPGRKAPKQEGLEEIKCRCIHLGQALSPAGIALISSELHTMMGIKAVRVSKTEIEIRYDLLQASLQQIEDRLVQIGIQLGGGWAERLRRALIHESEELQIDSLEVSPLDGHHF